MPTVPGRRKFIKQLTALSVLPVLEAPLPHTADSNTGKEGEGWTFLFQGDSITDGNRTRNNDWNHVMGHGYQYIIASKLWYELPEKGFHFLNRGISGNKVTDLAARWQQDTLDLKPDVLSILIGINDVSAGLKGNKEFTADQYEQGYRSLLEQTLRQLPTVRFVLCEPFVLPAGGVKDRWDAYKTEVDQRRMIVHKLSREYKGILVEFQAAFNKALSKAPAPYWIWDGVHPMPAGHELMAREWLRQVGRQLKFIR
ncbi:MAG: SGNH/GDSL hydrolase family protein [Williamsia sp.]|nr:SGNH/GDSL hydrolase family protein [Williamsia sp.]